MYIVIYDNPYNKGNFSNYALFKTKAGAHTFKRSLGTIRCYVWSIKKITESERIRYSEHPNYVYDELNSGIKERELER